MRTPCIFTLLSIILLCGCSKPTPLNTHGYIETRLIYLSSPLSGKIIQLHTQRGQTISQNQILVTLEQQPQSTNLLTAQANLAEAQANLANLQKGARPTEIQAIEAQLIQAKAKQHLAKLTQNRQQTLYKQQFTEEQTIDQAEEALTSAQAQIAEINAQLQTAQLPARPDLIHAAQAKVLAAQATLDQSQWLLSQKTLKAPITGTTFDIFFEPGEDVPPNTPILAILNPSDIYAVFFINQSQLNQLHIGKQITIHTDESTHPTPATISYISPKAEFTPPVIYSESAREKLVFKVEAHFSPNKNHPLHPGQPINISL